MTPVSVRRHRFSALGMSGSCSTEGLSASATTNNQLSGIGVTYDAAGTVTKDNLANTYTYDQENRIATVEGHTYSYDADGTRMEKASESTGTMYWPGPSGTLAEINLAGTINEEYILLQRQAHRPRGSPQWNAQLLLFRSAGFGQRDHRSLGDAAGTKLLLSM